MTIRVLVSHVGKLKQQCFPFYTFHLTVRIPELCLAVISPNETKAIILNGSGFYLTSFSNGFAYPKISLNLFYLLNIYWVFSKLIHRVPETTAHRKWKKKLLTIHLLYHMSVWNNMKTLVLFPVQIYHIEGFRHCSS